MEKSVFHLQFRPQLLIWGTKLISCGSLNTPHDIYDIFFCLERMIFSRCQLIWNYLMRFPQMEKRDFFNGILCGIFFIKDDALQQKYFCSKKHYIYSWMNARLMNTCSKEKRQDKLLGLSPPSTFFHNINLHLYQGHNLQFKISK